MKKIINNPKQVVNETLDGFVAAYADLFERVADIKGVKVKEPKDKVAFVIGGGSGHEPMFEMFLGENLADAAACGNIFASPDPNTIMKTVMSVEQGKGVLFVYGNYAGDKLNFNMATEFLKDIGVSSKTVRVWDDVASAPDRTTDRRGIAGDVFVIKIGGAVTGAGIALEEAFRVTAKARDNIYSIGVALSGGTIPGETKPSFELPEDEIEFGMGVHGRARESSVSNISLLTRLSILWWKIIEDSGIKSGDRICTLVNGLGSTTLSELYIMNRRLGMVMQEEGIAVHEMDVNSLSHVRRWQEAQ